MVRAYVVVNAEPGRAVDVQQALRGRPGIHAVDIVIGAHDLILSVEAADLNAIGTLVMDVIHGVPGVANTQTYPVVEAEARG